MKHGLTRDSKNKKHRLHQTWRDMRCRCRNDKHKHYHCYGGRGISICEEWNDYLAFHNWAIDNGYKEGLSIERINNDGDYNPNNCKWATQKEQTNNRSTNIIITFNGQAKSRKQWADELEISSNTLKLRLKRWSLEKALTEPVSKKHQNN